MNRRGVFLDLNGTLVEPLKQERLDELTLIPGAAEALARLTAAGFVCPVVTVQSRIAKGLFSMADFQAWFATFAADLKRQGALIVGPYVCPHRLAEPCPCKKPNVLLYERAASDHQLTAADCFVIGDSPDDIGAAAAWEPAGVSFVPAGRATRVWSKRPGRTQTSDRTQPSSLTQSPKP